MNPAIETFFADRKRDDLLLLYFSGHGIKDQEGRLYLTTSDTSRKLLRTTAISATMVNDVMRSSRSRRQVLLPIALRRTAGWSWRGFYLDNAYFLGIRYERPLTVTFENNFGNNPTATRELDLEDSHFFSLSREEQFEGLIKFLQTASQEVPKGSVSAEPIE